MTASIDDPMFVRDFDPATLPAKDAAALLYTVFEHIAAAGAALAQVGRTHPERFEDAHHSLIHMQEMALALIRDVGPRLTLPSQDEWRAYWLKNAVQFAAFSTGVHAYDVEG